MCVCVITLHHITSHHITPHTGDNSTSTAQLEEASSLSVSADKTVSPLLLRSVSVSQSGVCCVAYNVLLLLLLCMSVRMFIISHLITSHHITSISLIVSLLHRVDRASV